MTVNIELPREIEAKLVAEAEACGVPLDQYVRDFLLDHYEELEDWRIAEARLEDRRDPLSLSQLRKNLGLEH